MLQPLFDNIIVSVDKRQEQTEGGLFIPDMVSEDRPQKGKVLSVGQEVQIVREGDEVVFKKYSPDEVKIGEETVLILKEEDVIALVK